MPRTVEAELLSSGRTGAQTVGRAIQLLRLAMEAGASGLKLRDAIAHTGWSKSTVHRLLCELEEGGLLRRGPGKAYLLGRFAHELGIAQSPLAELQDICADALVRISQETEGTVFLGVRSGPSSLCLDYSVGVDVRPPVVPPRGAVRPLGVGAAGLAVLSQLHDPQVDAISEQNARRLAAYGVESSGLLQTLVSRARADGYATVANIVVPGVVGIGACITDPIGTPLCSISIVAPVRRMTASRERVAVRSLFDEIKALRPVILARAGLMDILRA